MHWFIRLNLSPVACVGFLSTLVYLHATRFFDQPNRRFCTEADSSPRAVPPPTRSHRDRVETPPRYGSPIMAAEWRTQIGADMEL